MPWTIDQPAGLRLAANVAKPSQFAAAAPLSLPVLCFMNGTGQTSLPDGLTRDAPTPITQANSDLLNQDVGGADWPFIVWAAFSTSWTNTSNANLYDDIHDNAAAYKIDVNQIYYTGLSLGGIAIASYLILADTHSTYRPNIKGVFPCSGSNTSFSDPVNAQRAVDRNCQPLRGWYGENDPNTWVVGAASGMFGNGIDPDDTGSIIGNKGRINTQAGFDYYELTMIPGAGHTPAAWGVPYSDNSQGANTIYHQILLNSVTAPVYQASEVTDAIRTEIVLTYDIALDAASVPATTDFAVNAGSITNVAISGSIVTLTVTPAYGYGDSIIISYTAGTNPIQDGAGNPADNLVNEAVTNNILDTTPPTIPTGLVASNIDKTSFTVSWDASTDTESGVSHYIVLLDGVSQGAVFTLFFDFSGLSVGTQYSITIQAVDNDNNVSAESTALLITTLDDFYVVDIITNKVALL